jgi:hypothetical protein
MRLRSSLCSYYAMAVIELGQAVAEPPRVRIVVVRIELDNPGADMRDRHGTVRTSIQGSSGGEVAAAGERFSGRSGAGSWHRSTNAGALAKRCAVHAGSRAGMDSGGSARGSDCHSGSGRDGTQCLVPRAWRISQGTCPVARKRHPGAGCARGCTSQPSANQARSPAHQGTRARGIAQGQGVAETAALLVLSRKLEAIFNTDKGEAE